MHGRKYGDQSTAKPLILEIPTPSIWQKCREDYYKTKLDYISTAPIRNKIEKAGDMLNNTINTYPESAYGKAIEFTMSLISPMLRELDDIAAAKSAYHADELRLDAEFRADLKSEFHTEDYPDESSIFALAWEEGHSSGYGEVLYHYSTIVEKFESNIRRTKNLMTVAKAFWKDACTANKGSSSCVYCESEYSHMKNCPVRLAADILHMDK